MLKKRRAVAFATAFVLLFTLCVSSLYIVHRAKHNCSGEDCQICANISACLKIVNNHVPKPESIFNFSALAFFVVLLIGTVLPAETFKTLITLKIKLTN